MFRTLNQRWADIKSTANGWRLLLPSVMGCCLESVFWEFKRKIQPCRFILHSSFRRKVEKCHMWYCGQTCFHLELVSYSFNVILISFPSYTMTVKVILVWVLLTVVWVIRHQIYVLHMIHEEVVRMAGENIFWAPGSVCCCILMGFQHIF